MHLAEDVALLIEKFVHKTMRISILSGKVHVKQKGVSNYFTITKTFRMMHSTLRSGYITDG